MAKGIWVSDKMSWFHGFVPVDTQFITFDDAGNATKRTIPAGTLVRLYQGWIGGSDAGLQSPKPDEKNVWWTEVAPDTNGEFWSAYLVSPAQNALMASEAYKADADNRQKRNGYAKVDAATLLLPEIKGSTDLDLSTADAKPRKPDYKKLTPQEIEDAIKDKPAGGGSALPWLLIAGAVAAWVYSKRGA